jgi:hypothetical protein
MATYDFGGYGRELERMLYGSPPAERVAAGLKRCVSTAGKTLAALGAAGLILLGSSSGACARDMDEFPVPEPACVRQEVENAQKQGVEHRYAALMVGNDEEESREDLLRFCNVLNRNGFPAANIYILYPGGDDVGLERVYARGNGEEVTGMPQVIPISRETIWKTFEILNGLVDGDDFLVVWSIGHGSHAKDRCYSAGEGGETVVKEIEYSYLCLPGGEIWSQFDLAYLLEGTEPGQGLVFVDHCNSAGYAALGKGKFVAIVNTRYFYGVGKRPVDDSLSRELFEIDFERGSPDADGDGRVSVLESFNAFMARKQKTIWHDCTPIIVYDPHLVDPNGLFLYIDANDTLMPERKP